MKKITINYLSHDRPEYSELLFHFLSKIKPSNKSVMKLNILASTDLNWDEKIKNLDIEYEIKIFEGKNNYIHKINFALQSITEYSMKLDEDCFFSNYLWDYMIENINILDNPDYLVLCPLMSNQIPSCDAFIEKYVHDEKVKNKIYDFFLKREMPNGLWNTDYTPLNFCTINSNKWSSNSFYQNLKELKSPFKGIHPLRISYEAQMELNNYLSENLDLFVNKNDYNFIEIDSPYFTNSCFFIKTKEWNEILKIRRLDDYDEVNLNQYKEQNNKKLMFVDNGFGFHLMFNTVYGNRNPWGIGGVDGLSEEKYFFNKLLQKIIK